MFCQIYPRLEDNHERTAIVFKFYKKLVIKTPKDLLIDNLHNKSSPTEFAN